MTVPDETEYLTALYGVFEVNGPTASFLGLYWSADEAFQTIGRFVVAGGYASNFKVLPVFVGDSLNEVTGDADWLEP